MERDRRFYRLCLLCALIENNEVLENMEIDKNNAFSHMTSRDKLVAHDIKSIAYEIDKLAALLDNYNGYDRQLVFNLRALSSAVYDKVYLEFIAGFDI